MPKEPEKTSEKEIVKEPEKKPTPKPTIYNLQLKPQHMKFLSTMINKMQFGVGEHDECKLATEVADIMNVEIKRVQMANLANQAKKDADPDNG